MGHHLQILVTVNAECDADAASARSSKSKTLSHTRPMGFLTPAERKTLENAQLAAIGDKLSIGSLI
jgi:hypothetical protein